MGTMVNQKKMGLSEGFEQCSHVQIASLSELLERNIETGTFSLHFGGDFDSMAFAEFPKSTHWQAEQSLITGWC